MHVLWLLFQFITAGAITNKNPFKALITMMPAYMTALGTQSSAATIPVTLMQTKKEWSGRRCSRLCDSAVCNYPSFRKYAQIVAWLMP